MTRDPPFDVRFKEPRQKPDHDPHGDINAHLSSWSCPNCGASGSVPTATLDALYMELDVDEDEIRCEHCAPEDGGGGE